MVAVIAAARKERRSSSSSLSSFLGATVIGVMTGLAAFMIHDHLYHSVDVSSVLTTKVVGTKSNRAQVPKMMVQPKELWKAAKPAVKAKEQAKEKVAKQVTAASQREQQQQAQKKAGSDQNNTPKERESKKQPDEPENTDEIEHSTTFLKNHTPTDLMRSLQDVPAKEPQHKVHFIGHPQVTDKDSFSASWLQSTADFMEMKLNRIQLCEDAAFKAWSTRQDKLRMTMDYLDFAVEHLSRWWRVLNFFVSGIAYDSIMNKLEQYVKAGATDYPISSSGSLVLGETIAVIAFLPTEPGGVYSKMPKPAERAYNLTIASLAATIESLRQAEMGRVVVVGSDPSHAVFTQQTIDYLNQHLKIPPNPDKTADQSSSLVGHLEVAYAQVTPEQAHTRAIPRNMPKGALVGARAAFELADKVTQTEAETQLLHEWFGTRHNPQHWKYLYLTEPDSILTTRKSALPQIKEEIDLRGGIISPFRLQPIPHESDLQGYKKKDRLLQKSDGFQTVIELDHYQHDVCCDELGGATHRPGKSEFPPCGVKKWFLCGFEEENPTSDPHQRLRPYQLIRLKRGIGLTTIAGNLFARRCFAGRKVVCQPPSLS